MPAHEANDERLSQIRAQARAENVRFTQHAHEEMAEEDITIGDVFEAIANAQIIEDYPEHRRGPCALLGGQSTTGRPIHIVCATSHSLLIIITVYKPKLPKWRTLTERSPKE
ncbi:MAG: DUF4258 domain-containing protein [Candidatus Acidiferrales bacterium]